MSQKDAWTEFEKRMHELRDLQGVLGILGWDQETFMPPKAALPRAQQLSTMQGLYHERLSDPALGDLIQNLRAQTNLTDDQTAMLRNLAWERDRAVKVPGRLVRELAEKQAHSVEAWRAARAKKDFAPFRPHLEALVKLKREQADAYGHAGERYDALLEGYEPGMRTARLEPLFAALKAELIPLVHAITNSGKSPDGALAGKTFDVEKQWAFTMRLLKDLQFDLEAGRQDRSTHPFTGGGGHPYDVRLTTRLYPELPLSAVMSTVHEAGHGLYEQGFAEQYFRTTVAQSPSMGMHESQSRFWENVIGRSLPFWKHYFPIFREHFPKELDGISLERFYGIVNNVERTLIRVEADEVTYNLHILLRFELELGILRGKLEVQDLPEAWNARIKEYLDVTPSSPAEGFMQDIHWAWGEFGYFPTYTLGNLYSATWREQMQTDIPTLWSEVEKGNFAVVLNWLRTNIHHKGFLYSAEELARNVTGQGLSEKPFMAYLWGKYGPLYGIHK